MWIVFHAIFWDGNAANKEDIIDSLLSPGKLITNTSISIVNFYFSGVKISLKGNTTDGETRRVDLPEDRVFLDPVDTLVEVL